MTRGGQEIIPFLGGWAGIGGGLGGMYLGGSPSFGGYGWGMSVPKDYKYINQTQQNPTIPPGNQTQNQDPNRPPTTPTSNPYMTWKWSPYTKSWQEAPIGSPIPAGGGLRDPDPWEPQPGVVAPPGTLIPNSVPGSMSDPSLNKTGPGGLQLPQAPGDLHIPEWMGMGMPVGTPLDKYGNPTGSGKPNLPPPQATPTGTGYSMQPQIPQNLTAPTSAFGNAYTPLSALTSSYQNRIGKAKGMSQWNPAYSSFWQNISYA